MDPREVLAECPLFARLSASALDALAEHAEMVEIASGRTLFERGSPPESIYIVATGRLCAVLPDGSIAGMLARLEPIGEIGALSGEPRNAAVHAVRDSLLVRIPGKHLYEVLGQYPDAMMQMSRMIIQRMRQNQRAQRLQTQRRVRCIAIVPAADGVNARSIAEQLRDALSQYSAPTLIDATSVDSALGPGAAQTRIEAGEENRRLVEHLNRIERDSEYVIYLADHDADAWARRCMRQADRILMAISADTAAVITPMVDELRRCGSKAPVTLVVARPEAVSSRAVMAWHDNVGAGAHYYVRNEHASDYAALARQLTGRGIGLVLGGGGARGFAHIGLLRALAELRIPVDAVGGSSMGAFLSALIACGYDHNEILHITRETFVTHNYLNDYLFPTVALIRGRKFLRRLREVFDDRRIEDLRKPYFCVSTNLTRGAAMVHDRGPLYMWVATSMAVPGVAPPVVYHGELLCDGGVMNNLPTDVMQAMERGPIIASDVSSEGGLAAPGIEGPDAEGLFHLKGGDERPRLFSIIFRTATLTSESGSAQRAARADAYLRMPVSGIQLFDWKRIDEVVERGYRHALEQLQPVRDKLLRSSD